MNTKLDSDDDDGRKRRQEMRRIAAEKCNEALRLMDQSARAHPERQARRAAFEVVAKELRTALEQYGVREPAQYIRFTLLSAESARFDDLLCEDGDHCSAELFEAARRAVDELNDCPALHAFAQLQQLPLPVFMPIKAHQDGTGL